MRMGKLIFFDSDTQCDFVEPWGALYALARLSAH